MRFTVSSIDIICEALQGYKVSGMLDCVLAFVGSTGIAVCRHTRKPFAFYLAVGHLVIQGYLPRMG
ncbi:MAG: hypothetical protein P4L49_09910 [Desulfosporosinus sp.]|nr:hypothetical protein [Desulfosporosinus sp.]